MQKQTDKFLCYIPLLIFTFQREKIKNTHSFKFELIYTQFFRFYASEVLLAIEYLHMLGIIYRDLKPENVLVREGGHIMLSDFDLSLRCHVCPKLVKSTTIHVNSNAPNTYNSLAPGCIQPSSFFPRILPKKKGKSKSDFGPRAESNLELLAEPSSARSMSFVGTHEYLAPEIICGEGHGSAVDWWTFGIFLYELLHGTTPFKGPGHRATLSNVVGQPLRFPEAPSVTSSARDLIKGLLVKNPHQRIAYKRGATEIKQHPFFEGVNWALVRCAVPPHVPDPVDLSVYASKDGEKMGIKGMLAPNGICRHEKKNSDDASYIHFDYF